MKDKLAEQLLAKVLGWTADEVMKERPRLQAAAAYKYDGYQQFEPGMRFVESLAQWLHQFGDIDERQAAYSFVMSRLVYISSEEMAHLVRTAYPDYMKHEIMRHAATQLGLSPYRIAAISASKEFHVLRRRSLFLGLSDGAHTDLLRRANRDEIGHEQVYPSHEMAPGRAEKLTEKLKEELASPKLLGRPPTIDEATFRLVFLLDDFTGSGITYLRAKPDGGRDGKIATFMDDFKQDGSPLSLLVARDADIYVVFYVATHRAIEHIRRQIESIEAWSEHLHIRVCHRLPESLSITAERDPDFHAICAKEDYFDPGLDDVHGAVGGESFRFGFSGCSLPLVLSHNSPNNSVAVLWSHEDTSFPGLFPRVPRHGEVGK